MNEDILKKLVGLVPKQEYIDTKRLYSYILSLEVKADSEICLDRDVKKVIGKELKINLMDISKGVENLLALNILHGCKRAAKCKLSASVAYTTYRYKENYFSTNTEQVLKLADSLKAFDDRHFCRFSRVVVASVLASLLNGSNTYGTVRKSYNDLGEDTSYATERIALIIGVLKDLGILKIIVVNSGSIPNLYKLKNIADLRQGIINVKTVSIDPEEKELINKIVNMKCDMMSYIDNSKIYTDSYKITMAVFLARLIRANKTSALSYNAMMDCAKEDFHIVRELTDMLRKFKYMARDNDENHSLDVKLLGLDKVVQAPDINNILDFRTIGDIDFTPNHVDDIDLTNKVGDVDFIPKHVDDEPLLIPRPIYNALPIAVPGFNIGIVPVANVPDEEIMSVKNTNLEVLKNKGFIKEDTLIELLGVDKDYLDALCDIGLSFKEGKTGRVFDGSKVAVYIEDLSKELL